jgi:hypothetical protein
MELNCLTHRIMALKLSHSQHYGVKLSHWQNYGVKLSHSHNNGVKLSSMSETI